MVHAFDVNKANSTIGNVINNHLAILVVQLRVIDALGSFGAQEVRVTLSCTSRNSYASFVLFKLPVCIIT